MMRQLAAQQQLIREATERIAERAEQMAQMLGSLEDVAGEMTEVEKSLRQGELNEDVLERQAQISDANARQSEIVAETGCR